MEFRNLYIRTRGHTLRPNRQALLAEALPARLLAGVTREENPARSPVAAPRPLWLEVGFGSGEHLVETARRHPDVTHLGAEVFVNGVAALLAKLAAEPLANVLIHPGDARDLLEVLPEGSLGRAYLLYPDPWPKARHHRRRFVSPEPLALLRRALAPGAELRVATDVPDYMRQAVEEGRAAGFEVEGPGAAPWEDWTPTRYEAKALREGRAPAYAVFRRP
jgi:tRNA (guanine-N7-)-methyltransferase